MKNKILSPLKTLVLLTVIIVFVEAFIMLLIHNLNHFTSSFTNIFLDSFLLIIFIYPILFFAVFKPMKDYLDNIIELNSNLSESEKQYRNLASNIPGMLYRGNSDWTVEIIENSQTISGYSISEFKSGKINWLNLIHNDYKEKILKETQNFQKGSKLSQDYKIVTKSGKIKWVRDIKKIVFDDEGAFLHVDGIVLDINHNKILELEKEKLELELTHVHKLESLGTLTGGIAHDFNNICGIILGNAEFALNKTPASSPIYDSLEDIKNASLRAKDVIGQLLVFSQKHKDSNDPIQLDNIISESLKLLRSIISRTIMIQTKLNTDDGYIVADPTQINQIMMNLCCNAADAIGETAGLIRIETNKVIINENLSQKYGNLNPGEYIQIIVKDNGQGIPPKAIKNIFDPYFTTKTYDSKKGSGLGLSVVYGIIKKLQGHISVESKLGEGTSFEIFLPTVEIDIKIEDYPKITMEKGNERILFVDDEELMVKMGKRLLTDLGYSIETKTSPLSAIESFKNNPNNYDLVITDMSMPELNGERLSLELIKIRPDIPVILCTGHSDIIDEKKSKKSGIKEFVLKPLDQNTISQVIRRVLDNPDKISIPAREKSTPPIEAKGGYEHKANGRILIMDDDDSILKVSKRILSSMGYEVVFAKDGQEAIDKYAQEFLSGNPFDVVILDLAVPGSMGGAETIPEILKINPDAKVIISSGNPNDPVMINYKSYGLTGIIPKPYRQKQMAELLNRIFGDKNK